MRASALRADELAERARAISWYHTLELAPGVLTDGMFDLRRYVERYRLPADLRGVRALDVGTFDGFWSFEMERRGATVTALDIDSVQQLDWPPRLRPAEDRPHGEGFRLAHAALGSSVERVGVSIYDATPERLGGTYDLVFCGSVLIHLRDPLLALERMAALCRGRLVLAEERARRLLSRSPAAEFRGLSPWMVWWIATGATWARMAEIAGFRDARVVDQFTLRFRRQRGGVPHAVVHARGPAR